ncbi:MULTISPECIES: helix-turn-helix transcriptional regulator [Methylobacterium]|jgi:XRE family aerobic/anaerobic benzoate catabolism transcriptional regulator|uniref:Shikimate kinase n=2 Tax=Methylobacterium TaxID=407 RepID=A0A0C6FIE5_9HYPH|nr:MULTISPECIES: helix-turn-helix transcriptional regulator [Methylobacterium]MBZ6411894.1 helix-turn-helix transcriptional regulator [Methylobacterium sp.]MBK3398201.1 helix-turn-helix transcriptional regulator [Methylobacterium ajmalii]MBK3407463.1 helix-turn-helix transcriptional regulator [Methylobacterium ajmalii]MBK3420424.1 helix-turn-helix transcriptional regulator [Methylobacterium ajmalii]SFF17881.1 shikimate kinase [Methylobacterium sp. yr596]
MPNRTGSRPSADAPEADEPEAGDAEAEFLTVLGQRVRTMRAVRAMSRKVLSQTSGLSERYIAQLEGGQGNVSIILLRRVAIAMGVRLEDLIAAVESPPDWPVVRDLLEKAGAEQISEAKRILSGAAAPGEGPTQRVALIGLRGAGKSTLGRILAERMGWTFVELNREIERENGLSVAEIFAIYGQETYRRLEQGALRQLAERPGPMVLATGGGIVAEPVTYDLLLSSFFTVWLKARPEEHIHRVREQAAKGLAQARMPDSDNALREIRAVLMSREPLYARARAVIDTADHTVAETAGELTGLVEGYLGGNARRGI